MQELVVALLVVDTFNFRRQGKSMGRVDAECLMEIHYIMGNEQNAILPSPLFILFEFSDIYS